MSAPQPKQRCLVMLVALNEIGVILEIQVTLFYPDLEEF